MAESMNGRVFAALVFTVRGVLYALEQRGSATLLPWLQRYRPVSLAPGQRMLIPTGIAVALPQGCEAQVRPRSGLAAKHGVTLLNSPGTIDADYRGEIQVLLINLGAEPVAIERGMRIAQMVIAPVSRGRWREVTSLPDSDRGAGGFGSTGHK